MSPLYFDYAAATPLAPEVLAAMQPFFSGEFYNPSAAYLAAKQVREALETARAGVASHLGAKPSEIIFTAGGTEADNLAIHGVMRQHPDTNLVISAIEHDAVLEPAKQYPHQLLPVTKDGRVDVSKLEKLINGRTVLVSVMLANNEIGTIQPLREVVAVLQKIRKKRSKQDNPLPLYLHTDACQAAAWLDLRVARLGVDLMTINAGKIYGPKQCAALFVGSRVRLSPLMHGGGQERGLRNGTENIANFVGLAKALNMVQAAKDSEGRRLAGLQKLFYKLLEEKIPHAVVNGAKDRRLVNNVHITIPGQDNERLLYALDEKGIQCATGSACSAASTDPSHVLKAIGLSDDDARSSLRFTFGKGTTEEAIRMLVDELVSVLE